jgi:hypothetical protein
MPVTVAVSPTDEDLNQLEKDIRNLKIEYEQYFGGGRSRPPVDTEWRIEQMIKRHSERGTRLNSGQRFKFSGLTQTYAKYREIFRKRAKQKEEGTVTRHFGAAAREIEAQRKEKGHGARQGSGVVSRVQFNPIGDPAREHKKAKELYEVFRSAKERAGENTQKLSLEAFESFLARKAGELRGSKKTGSVEFAVELDGGQVKLKARVSE